MNKVILTGNLTKDPEGNNTNSGTSYCRFSIAVHRRFKNADGEKEADFLNCIAWKNNAEIISKYCKKGSKVGIVGSLQTGSYDAKDGTKRYTTDIVVDEVELLSTNAQKQDNEPQGLNKGFKQEAEQLEMQPIEDITMPF